MTKTECEALRREIKTVADKVWELRGPPESVYEGPPEAYANATLAYRHLEDASMRLGKALRLLRPSRSISADGSALDDRPA